MSVLTSPDAKRIFTNTFSFEFIVISLASSNIMKRLQRVREVKEHSWFVLLKYIAYNVPHDIIL